MPNTSSNLVPNSIQRIRTFLNEACGMKVRPWAGVAETLDALHEVLRAKRDCPVFWKSLQVLLDRLAQDLHRRKSAATAEIIDNEVLSSDGYAALLDEIKAALAPESSSGGTFAKLAAAVSMPAAKLLFLLAGVSTVGCTDHRTLAVSRQDASGIVADALPVAMADGPLASVAADGPFPAPEPDRPSAIAVADGPQAQKQDGNRPDSADLIILAGPDAGPEVASRLCDGACSLEDIMIACGMDPATRQAISACVERLKISWREGLTAGWATRSCNDISAMTGPSCLASYCQPGRVSTSEFIASVLDCREPPIYPVYIGVRFP